MDFFNAFRIALFGHRDFGSHNDLEKKLFPLLREITSSQGYVEIYIGRNGEFDVFTATIIRRLKREPGEHNIDMTCILPYTVKDIEHYAKYYDDIIIPDTSIKTPLKYSIIKRNKWMVEHADLVICYVERSQGGAYEAMKYANKINKRVINLADIMGDVLR